MMDKSAILDIFRKVLEKPMNNYLEKWISEGGKCIGHNCSLFPGEIFTAAGMMPYRIMGSGSEDTSMADVYVSAKFCSFVKHTVNLALEGKFDFLSGIVFLNACEQLKRAFHVWEYKTKIPFKSFINVPKSSYDPEKAVNWLRGELSRLIQELEDHFSIKVSPEDLLKAIKLHNTARKNLRKISELRKSDNPPISGSEALLISVAASVMPLEDYNSLIGQLIEQLEINKEPKKYRARFILSGGEMDEPEFVKIIEDQGAIVVYDDVCCGSRYYEDLVSEEGDPLTKIAERYVYRVPCARTMNSFADRYNHIQQAKKDFRADGMIYQRMMFCVANGGYMQILRHNLRTDENAIPTLFLEREYQTSGRGQISTRVQAFIESIESKAKGGIA
ncbi:MAG: 2-hydroxyacyl-CoA dehydratase family protein [Firmicutes bacterium]|nr:2-hydroxyacyl-CoA dehydratase family protein [Bacillota bacterium]